MSDNYTPEQPEPVIPPEVVEDDPTKPYKAYAGAAITGAATFLAFWIGDEDPFTKKEAGQALIAALVAALPGFGIPFFVGNPKRVVTN